MEKLYKVRITPRAEQSMQEIASYIAVGLMEPQTAVKLLRALKKAIDSLDMFPGRIRPTPEEPWHSLGIRRLVMKNYYVYFWIDETNLCVPITDVIYAGQDQPTRLAEMPLGD